MPIDIELQSNDNSNLIKIIRGASKSALKSYFTDPGALSGWSLLTARNTANTPGRSRVIFSIYHNNSNSEWSGTWRLRCWHCPSLGGAGVDDMAVSLDEAWHIIEPSIPSNTGGRRKSRRRRNRSKSRSYRK